MGSARAARGWPLARAPGALLCSSGLVTVSIFRLGVAAPARSRGPAAWGSGFDRSLGWDEAAYGRSRRRKFPSDAGEQVARLRPTESWGLGGQVSRSVCLRRMGPWCVSLSPASHAATLRQAQLTHTHTPDVVSPVLLASLFARGPLKRRVE